MRLTLALATVPLLAACATAQPRKPSPLPIPSTCTSVDQATALQSLADERLRVCKRNAADPTGYGECAQQRDDYNRARDLLGSCAAAQRDRAQAEMDERRKAREESEAAQREAEADRKRAFREDCARDHDVRMAQVERYAAALRRHYETRNDPHPAPDPDMLDSELRNRNALCYDLPAQYTGDDRYMSTMRFVDRGAGR